MNALIQLKVYIFWVQDSSYKMQIIASNVFLELLPNQYFVSLGFAFASFSWRLINYQNKLSKNMQKRLPLRIAKKTFQRRRIFDVGFFLSFSLPTRGFSLIKLQAISQKTTPTILFGTLEIFFQLKVAKLFFQFLKKRLATDDLSLLVQNFANLKLVKDKVKYYEVGFPKYRLIFNFGININFGIHIQFRN